MIPALHIYNVITLAFLFAGGLQAWLHPDQFAMLLLGMVTGYAVLSVIPSIYLAAPDETSAFIVLPGQKWLLERRGYEAAILTGVGSLCGVMRAGDAQPVPHRSGAHAAHRSGSALWAGFSSAISLFMLMSEWPKARRSRPDELGAFSRGVVAVGRGPVDVLPVRPAGPHLDVSQLRAGVGGVCEFAAGLHRLVCRFRMVLTNLIMGTRVPPQHISTSIDLSPSLLLRGTFAGSLGGLFAAFFPVVTGGIGAFLAGHATAQRDERSFIVSQGVSKLVYYAGGFLLFFLPGLQSGARRPGRDGQHHLHAGHAADVLRRRGGAGGVRRGEFPAC